MKIRVLQMKENSILNIYSLKDQIDPEPEYQREGDLWNLYKQQLFIDSIITGFDVPKLYLHVLPKSEEPDSKMYAIIDGKQRLETIWRFIDNVFPLGDDTVHPETDLKLNGRYYRDLMLNFPALMSNFNRFPLPIMLVETSADGEILVRDMFLRLNESVSINATERRSAIGGNVIEIIKTLIEEPFFTKSIRIKDKRYLHRDICIKLLFLEYSLHHNGIIGTDKLSLDAFVKQFRTSELPKYVTDAVKKILNHMHNIFNNNDILLNSQARIPIYYLLFREAGDKLNAITRKEINDFVEAVKKNSDGSNDNPSKEDQALSAYHKLTIQGTVGGSSIKTRFQIIADYFGIKNSHIHYPQQQLTHNY